LSKATEFVRGKRHLQKMTLTTSETAINLKLAFAGIRVSKSGPGYGKANNPLWHSTRRDMGHRGSLSSIQYTNLYQTGYVIRNQFLTWRKCGKCQYGGNNLSWAQHPQFQTMPLYFSTDCMAMKRGPSSWRKRTPSG